MRGPILVLVLLSALSVGVPSSTAVSPTTGGFIVTCDYSHTLRDDPIVYPGQPGASHSHDFFGNQSTSADSTYDSMVQDTTSCGVNTDTAGYWVPTASINGTPIVPTGNRGDMRIYYRASGATHVTSLPAGLELIGGDKDATNPPPQSMLAWYCGAGPNVTTPLRYHPYDCTPYEQQYSFVDGVVAVINLPRCWNGSGLLPSDTVYPIPGKPGGINCPTDHSTVLPLVSERVHLGIMDPCAGLTPCGPDDADMNVRLTVSHGNAVDGVMEGPYYTLHADFWNTWHQDVLDTLVADCINAHVACGFQGSRYPLDVVQTGTGTGTVSSDPAGMNCSSSCTVSFPTATHVMLTATPAQGSSFIGWGGECSGTDACLVKMEHRHSVTATFDADAGQTYTLSVSRTGTGGGTITSEPAGVDCGDVCSQDFDPGSRVRLLAIPDDDSLFDGWSGGCRGVGECLLYMNKNRAVSAAFIPKVYGVDAEIRTPRHGFVGHGLIGGGGFQMLAVKAERGSTVEFLIGATNLGNTPDTFVFRGDGVRPKTRIRYLAKAFGSTSITRRVTSGSYTTDLVELQGQRFIRLVVHVSRKALPGAKRTWQIAVRSAHDRAANDVVQARVIVTRR